VRLLLDTAVLIFSVEAPDRISKRAMAALKNPENVRELSSISLTEIAVKVTLGKLDMPPAIVRQSIVDLEVRLVPFTSSYAFRLFELPLHHRDPFDRQIIAHALSEDIPVVTPDRRFAMYAGLKVIW
jgi:PIN domain nuclease of toxin-antitoxin system